MGKINDLKFFGSKKILMTKAIAINQLTSQVIPGRREP
jgi:hypothetical protein